MEENKWLYKIIMADGNEFSGDSYYDLVTRLQQVDHTSDGNAQYINNVKARFKVLHEFDLKALNCRELILELQEVGYITQITVRRVRVN